jgi:hypothetical protein
MQIKLIYLIIWLIINRETTSNNSETTTTDLIFTTSGLIMQYLADYKLAEQIIAFTVSIPMVCDMCYLIQICVAKKILQCEWASNINTTTAVSGKSRRKLFISDMISIGMGTLAIAL